MLDDSAHEKVYITEAQTKVPIAATGVISIENAEIAVLDSDIGSVESQKKYVTCIVVKQLLPTFIDCLTISLRKSVPFVAYIVFCNFFCYAYCHLFVSWFSLQHL